MSKTSTLAEGQLTQSPQNTITVELVAPDDMPAIVRIVWPLQPTVSDPRRFPDTAAVIARQFAEAATTLARIRASKRL
jgi:hypothetical protein